MQLRGPMPVKGWSCGDFEVCARAGAATAHRNRPWPQGQAPGHIYANDNATPRTDAGQRVGVAVCYLQMTCTVRLNTARPHTACRSVRRRQVCQEGLAALQQLRAANTQQQRCQERRTPPGRRLRVFMDSLVFFSTTTVLLLPPTTCLFFWHRHLHPLAGSDAAWQRCRPSHTESPIHLLTHTPPSSDPAARTI